MSPTETLDSADPRVGRSLAIELAVSAALAVAPFLLRVLSGTREQPNDDDWAYVRIFDTLHQTGHLVLVDWNDINLVGMFPVTEAWVTLVGNGPLRIHFLGSVMGFVVLTALVWSLRSIRARDRLLSIVLYGTFIGFVATTGTYMADLFAMAGSAVSLALVLDIVAARRSGPLAHVLVVGAAIAALFAFSVRQQTIVAAGVVALVLFLAGRSVRLGWLVFGVVYSAGIVPFYVWRSSLENGGSAIIGLSPKAALASTAVTVVILSVVLLPLVVRAHGLMLDQMVAVRIGLSALAAAVFASVDVTSEVTDTLTFVSRLASSSAVVRAVCGVVIANVVVTVAVGLVRRRLPSGNRLAFALALGAGLTLAADLVIASLGSGYYSRYSLFLLFLVLVLWPMTEPLPRDVARGGSTTAAWTTVALLALVSYWTLDGDLTEIRASVEGAEVAMCAGVPAGEIDAGFVWMGTHYDGVSVAQYQDERAIEDGLPASWYHPIFPDAERRVLVTPTRPDDASGSLVVGRIERSGLLPGNDAVRWIVVRDEDAALLGECGATSG